MTKKLSTPFAINSSLRNDVPVKATSEQTAKGIIGYTDGWTAINKLPVDNGGQAPQMEDFNGVLYDVTGNISDINKGLPQYFDTNFATSIGGYPVGARLCLDDNSGFVVSTIANNSNNPNSNMEGWELVSDVLQIRKNIALISDLRNYEPIYDGQVVNINSHSNHIDTNYGVPLGGGDFIYLPALTSDKYKDDNGTIIVTNGDKVWVRKELFDSKDHSIHAEWFGCDGTFYTDDASKITSAINACLFWRNVGTIDGKYGVGGINGGKTTLVMPKQWYIKSTVYINMTYITIDYNHGIGLISNNGTYDAHPLLSGYKMALAFRAEVQSGIDFVPAYYSNQIAKNGSLIYGDVSSNGNIGRFPLNDSKVICASYYGLTETIRTAVGTIDNVSYSCFGVGYSNGDYGWGYTHNDCKFDQCYEPFILVNAKDNGEKITHINTMSFNCGTLGNINTWGGDFQWLGGSWDYPNFSGLNLGTSSGHITCKIGRIEYNPCAISSLIDGFSASASCTLSDALMLFAAPSTGTNANNSMFKASYDNQFKFCDSRIIDHSASAALTQNHKIGNGFKVITDNIKSITLFDYFLTKSCVNAVGVGSWTIVNASDYLTYAIDTVKQTLTITSSATTAQEQIINVFIPLRDMKRFTDVSGIVTATKPNVNLNVAFSMGYLDLQGALHAIYYLDENTGQSFNFNNGVTFPYGAYGPVNIAKHFKHDQAINYTEQGMILRFNMFNLTGSSSSVVIDANATGAITI